MYFDGRGEMIPNQDCYCEINPNEVDQWGIPTLRLLEMVRTWFEPRRHMQHTFRDIIEAMGGQVLSTVQDDGAMQSRVPGKSSTRWAG